MALFEISRAVAARPPRLSFQSSFWMENSFSRSLFCQVKAKIVQKTRSNSVRWSSEQECGAEVNRTGIDKLMRLLQKGKTENALLWMGADEKSCG